MINQENTYLGADGLAYCKICGEPVEAFFPPDSILGMKKHFRQCACTVSYTHLADTWEKASGISE